MKRYLLLLMLLCSIRVSAQDVIVKRDGAAIVCRIINVSSLEIVYKKWTDLQGPNLVMSVADAASITYENGEKKVFENVTATQPLPIVQSNSSQQVVSDDMLLKMSGRPELTPQEKKTKRLKIAGWVVGPTLVVSGIILTIVGATNGGVKKYDAACLFPGIGAIPGGIAVTTACIVRANNLKKQASQLSVQSAPIFQQEFHLKNGTSLSPGINMLKDYTHRNMTLGLGLTYNF